MTKQRIESSLEDISEELLCDLSPDERLQLFLEAQGRGNERWIARLQETVPRRTYRMPDLAFTARTRMTLLLASIAVYRLHTVAIGRDLLERDVQLETVLAETRGEPPSEEEFENFREQLYLLAQVYGELYILYHAFQDLANSVFGTDLETWLATHPDGSRVLKLVRSGLEGEAQFEHAKSIMSSKMAGDLEASEDSEDAIIDELIERRASLYESFWNDGLGDFA